jgi:hypothetical protein
MTMPNRFFARIGIAALGAALVVAIETTALAAVPTVIWSTATGGGGLFSGDGSSILLTTSTGFQMRRSSDGVVEKTVTLPAASQNFDARAFSPDKQYVAIAIQQGAAFNLEIWSISTGSRVRTITTNAVRSIKTLDISSAGLLAAYERFAYGGGGYLRIFRISDGGFVTMLGPYTRNGTTRVRFSPNGQYVAAHDWVGTQGMRVLRTSDWGTVLTVGNFTDLFRWEPDSASVWASGNTLMSEPYKQVRIPAGTIQRSVAIDDSQFFATSVTADGRFILGFSEPRATMKFLRTSDGGAQVTYTLPSSSSSDISPTGKVFTYSVCNEVSCTFYLAQMPAL